MTVASGDHLRLLDQVAESVLVVAPVANAGAGTDGGQADFDIVHLSPGYIDPAGRARQEIAGRTLLGRTPTARRATGWPPGRPGSWPTVLPSTRPAWSARSPGQARPTRCR